MTDYRVEFQPGEASFADVSGAMPPPNQPWAPVTITAAQIDAEAARLAAAPCPANGRRSSLIVHPDARATSPGLAPGIQVTLSVLNPGERTQSFRHNATEVNFCIRGAGRTFVGDRTIAFSQYDVWNTPSFATYWRENDGDEVQVCLTYTNAALLQFMQVYLAETPPPSTIASTAHDNSDDPRRSSPFGTFQIGDDGAKLMPYELLINPPSVVSPALHWPWTRVQGELAKLEALGADYVGRRLYLMYNDMTGRFNGTTPNFFATITIRPPNIADRPHRHVSSAINYYFKGTGRSSVGGNIYEWGAGDLMLSAPGWTVHNHASYNEPVFELTVQDQPLNIMMESLLWQENMKSPPALFGAQAGFDTNRNSIA